MKNLALKAVPVVLSVVLNKKVLVAIGVALAAALGLSIGPAEIESVLTILGT